MRQRKSYYKKFFSHLYKQVSNQLTVLVVPLAAAFFAFPVVNGWLISDYGLLFKLGSYAAGCLLLWLRMYKLPFRRRRSRNRADAQLLVSTPERKD